MGAKTFSEFPKSVCVVAWVPYSTSCSRTRTRMYRDYSTVLDKQFQQTETFHLLFVQPHLPSLPLPKFHGVAWTTTTTFQQALEILYNLIFTN